MGGMKRRQLLLGAAAGLAVPAVLTPAAPALGATRPPTPAWATVPVPRSTRPTLPRRNLAARLTTLSTQTRQVVIVTAASATTTYATLEAYVRVRIAGSRPRRRCPPGSARRVSATTTWRACRPPHRGLLDRPHHLRHRREPGRAVPVPPAGQRGLVEREPVVHAVQHLPAERDQPGGASEALWKETPAYTYFAVITYNMTPNVPKPVPNAGSGIFLHQFGTSSGNATAGCVSLARNHLVDVLTWLDPKLSPRIVLTPYAQLDRY
ncbi:L,D-transpeptidase family protein [Micromonospora sp. M12]